MNNTFSPKFSGYSSCCVFCILQLNMAIMHIHDYQFFFQIDYMQLMNTRAMLHFSILIHAQYLTSQRRCMLLSPRTINRVTSMHISTGTSGWESICKNTSVSWPLIACHKSFPILLINPSTVAPSFTLRVRGKGSLLRSNSSARLYACRAIQKN